MVKRPLQHVVCLLHANELPLRNLFEHIHVDGQTTGPRCFSGHIGSLLQKCETMPIVSYEPIPCDFPVVTADYLSSDQQYLLDICHEVDSAQFHYLTVSQDNLLHVCHAGLHWLIG